MYQRTLFYQRGNDRVNGCRESEFAGSSEDSNRAFSGLQSRSCPESDVTGNSGEGIGETGHTGSRSTGNSGEGIGNTGSTDCSEYESPLTASLQDTVLFCYFTDVIKVT